MITSFRLLSFIIFFSFCHIIDASLPLMEVQNAKQAQYGEDGHAAWQEAGKQPRRQAGNAPTHWRQGCELLLVGVENSKASCFITNS